MKNAQQIQISKDLGHARESASNASSSFAAARLRMASLGYEPLNDLSKTIDDNRSVAAKCMALASRTGSLAQRLKGAATESEQLMVAKLIVKDMHEHFTSLLGSSSIEDIHAGLAEAESTIVDAVATLDSDLGTK